ncbi:hypothetical protein HNY73_008053 [Argiope bruennichi]|uniref:Uncharacterized protein n=1 Tax=Argiope bruennichi TaxID=94029 RepID=A0A8T0F636_ARGBR|nr:hypothetical protein HNY73_008053 [Argiope bruennichi]
MHSIASKRYSISRRDLSKISSDSGISEDIKESLEKAQCSSKVKHIGAKNNVDKILQLSANVKKRNKRKLDDEEPGSSTNFTSQEYLDKKLILQQLREKEKQLKIAIAYEKLRKEQPVFLDSEILNQKIADYERLLQEARNEYKMKNIMCVNLQLTNTIQKIVGKTKTNSKQKGFSASQRKHIEDLLAKKKELNRRIGVRRKVGKVYVYHFLLM